MAPFVGPTREALLGLLDARRPQLPITLGLYEPQAVVDCRDGRWLLMPLVMDHDAARRAGDEAMAAGQPWFPEMRWRFLAPGEPVIDEPDKAAFAARVRAMDYPYEQK